MNAEQQRARQRFIFWLVVVASIAFLWIARAMLLPLLWAVIFAVLLAPLNVELRRGLRGRRGPAAGFTVLIFITLVLVPLALLSSAVVAQATGLYQAIQSGAIDVQAPVAAVSRMVPPVQRFLASLGMEDALRQGISSFTNGAAAWLAARALVIGQNAVALVLMTFVMLYLLFFFLRDGERLLGEAQRVFPADDELERRLFVRFTQVTRATIKGTFIVGIVQGALGALAFGLLGIPAWLFWGVLMTLLAMLPVVGPTIIWAPAGIILLITGHPVKGIILLLFGTFVISLVDNLLRPLLVGRDTRIPDWVVFIAILGGIAAVGLSGFVVGPVVAGLFITAWEMLAGERDAARPAAPAAATDVV